MSSMSQYLAERLSNRMEPSSDTKDDVTRILSQDAYSDCMNIAGVKRADGAQLASNSPCEDRFNRVQLFSPWNDENWIAATVLDGHNGWQTADFLEKELLTLVQNRLRELQPQSRNEDTIQLAIEKTFIDLDDSIINNYVNSAHNKDMALEEKIRYMQIAMSGSCALLILYNPMTNTLYTACTGDSRGVLGQQNSDGTWVPVALSKDQTGGSEDEIKRLHQEHPNEAVIKNGKVLGMTVSRAFGDFGWKSSYDTQLELGKRFFTRGPMEKSEILTPPYLIAKPVVTVRKLELQSFLILATDGLWDVCTDREVVDLVVRWLEAQPDSAKEMKMTPMTVWWKSEPQQEANYAPGFDFLQRWNEFDVRFREERTVIQDLNNVAVHLLRNACGGNHRELLAGKLAFQPPYSRLVRDDMTIQVIFFNMSGLSR